MTNGVIVDAVSASAVIRLAAAQLAAFCALLLIASAAHKLLRGSRSRRAAGELAGVSPRRAALLVASAAIAEMSAGCLLSIAPLRVAGAALAAAIWALYGATLALAVARGRTDLDCGCSFTVAARPLGVYQVSRSLGLAGLACAVALAGPARPPPLRCGRCSCWPRRQCSVCTLRSIRSWRCGRCAPE